MANDHRARLDVSTKGCKFSDDSVLYFTSLTGGIAMDMLGARIIHNPSKTGFQVRVTIAPLWAQDVAGGGIWRSRAVVRIALARL